MKKQKNENLLWMENFHQRWNINLNQAERWKNFINRVLNSYDKHLADECCYSEVEDIFFEIIGVHYKKIYLGSKPTIYEHLIQLIQKLDVKIFIFNLEAIFRIDIIPKDIKNNFLKDIKDDISISGVPIEIKQTKTDILFYPAGAKLLDKKLVNDNLDWLSKYPESYEAFKNALLNFGKKGEERNVVDNLRLSLELLLKDVVKKQSLEKQKEEVGKYLKEKNVSVEVSNMFWTILNYYSKYQNENAKHGNTVPASEVEFMLYLTGTFMRFFLTR